MKLIFLLSAVMLVSGLSGCLKDSPSVDFTSVQTIIEISPPYAGLEYFDKAALTFDSGAVQSNHQFVVNIASPKTLSATLTITMGIDDSSRVAYNKANKTIYEALPDTGYSFPKLTGNIPAGARLDTFQIIFYPGKLDMTRSYMLPVSITDAQGKLISGNFHTIYYHTNAQ
jgi:hypothetical protein